MRPLQVTFDIMFEKKRVIKGLLTRLISEMKLPVLRSDKNDCIMSMT